MDSLISKTIILQHIIELVEMTSAGILLIGFFKGIYRFIRHEKKQFFNRDIETSLTGLRPEVGSYILLGLDFYIVSDILSTMLRPESTELISLAVIGLLRTTIGYFLAKEIA